MANTTGMEQLEATFKFIANVNRAAKLCGIELESALRFLAALGQEVTQPPAAAPGPERPQ